MLRLGGSTTCELLLCAHILSQEWFRSVCAIIVCYVSRCRVPSCRVVSSRARSSPGRAMAVRLPLSVFLCSFPFLGPGHRGCEEGSKTLDRNQPNYTPASQSSEVINNLGNRARWPLALANSTQPAKVIHSHHVLWFLSWVCFDPANCCLLGGSEFDVYICFPCLCFASAKCTVLQSHETKAATRQAADEAF